MKNNNVMSMNLGDAIVFVLDKDDSEWTSYNDLLDDLTECFWKMLPYYLKGVSNNGEQNNAL